MSRKRFSDNPFCIAGAWYVLVCVAIAGALSFPFRSQSEEAGEITLFAYSDVLQKKASVDGRSASVKEEPEGAAADWADMVIETGKDKGVYFEKKLDIDAGAKVLDFSVLVNDVHADGEDYDPAKARYPFFLLLVFEGTPRDISIKKRVFLWIKSLRSKKVERRHNLLYIFANSMPKESIVNTYPGGAIISIGDDRDVGRLIHVRRDLGIDYKLAFGSELRSRLKKVVVGFEGEWQNEKTSPVSVSTFLLKPSP